MLIFISHAHKDRREAAALKVQLSNFGIDVFLAHEDIDGSEEWIPHLLCKLRECDVFLVLFSKNYHNGKYTDQESGMALGYDKAIIPIRIDDTEPYGFIASLQFATCNKIFSDNDVTEILRLIALRDKDKLTDSLIQHFAAAPSFREAGNRIMQLEQYSPFTDKQVNDLATAYIDNYQIRESFDAAPVLKRIVRDNATQLDPVVKRMLKGWSLSESHRIEDL